MIKSFTANTREIDDPKAAVSEILEALDMEKNLLKNSLGIISCFSEFGETGVLKAICDALPFECIGTTTCLCATGTEMDQMLLTIMVLTSDDCEFCTTMIQIDDNYESVIPPKMDELFQKLSKKPSLFMGYFPLMNNLGGDLVLAVLDKATEGIPIYGTLAVDHNMDYSTALTIYRGELCKDALVLGGIIGEFEMHFDIASIREDKIKRQKAIITESKGNILIGINGKTALDYLEEIGLSRDDLSIGVGVVPLAISHEDGTKPVTRGVFATTPEGYVVAGGGMPVGATISLGHINEDDVISTTADVMKKIVKKDSVIFSYSCIGRYLVLKLNETAEARKIFEIAGEEVNYLFSCSGGEICPLYDTDGKLKNHFHNYTNVFCRLG